MAGACGRGRAVGNKNGGVTRPTRPPSTLRFEKKRCRDELGAENEQFMGNVMYFPRAFPTVRTQRGPDLRPPHT